MGVIQLFIARDESGNTVALRPVELRSMGLDAEALTAVFGDRGQMHELILREPTYALYLEIQRACQVAKPDGSGMEIDPTRAANARVQALVERWTLPGDPIDGLGHLPSSVAISIDAALQSYLFPSLRDTTFYDKLKSWGADPDDEY